MADPMTAIQRIDQYCSSSRSGQAAVFGSARWMHLIALHTHDLENAGNRNPDLDPSRHWARLADHLGVVLPDIAPADRLVALAIYGRHIGSALEWDGFLVDVRTPEDVDTSGLGEPLSQSTLVVPFLADAWAMASVDQLLRVAHRYAASGERARSRYHRSSHAEDLRQLDRYSTGQMIEELAYETIVADDLEAEPQIDFPTWHGLALPVDTASALLDQVAWTVGTYFIHHARSMPSVVLNLFRAIGWLRLGDDGSVEVDDSYHQEVQVAAPPLHTWNGFGSVIEATLAPLPVATTGSLERLVAITDALHRECDIDLRNSPSFEAVATDLARGDGPPSHSERRAS